MSQDSMLKSYGDRGSQTASIDDAQHPTVKAAIDYWRAVRGARRFPARSELTLRGMAAVLPFTLIVAVIDGGADYEFRYVGDAERQAFKRDFKGMRVTDVEKEVPFFGNILHSTYDKVRANGEPFVVRGLVDHEPSDKWLPYHETAFLPLGSADVVDHILIVGVSVPRPER